jgi:hypothetical protein
MRERLMPRSWAVLTAVLFAILLTAPGQAFAQADKYHAAGSTAIFFGPFVTGSTTVNLLSQNIQNSNTADLVLQVTLECGMVTSEFGASSFTDARVNVWVEIDGARVPVTSNADGSTTESPIGEVIFCDHLQSTFNFAPEFDIEQLVHANAFNWVKLNVGAGQHSVVVRARLDSLTSAGQFAQAFVRRRTLIIEPVHMVKDEAVQPALQ